MSFTHRVSRRRPVKRGTHIFTDAWHPGIINVKYMAELLGIKVITHDMVYGMGS